MENQPQRGIVVCEGQLCGAAGPIDDEGTVEATVAAGRLCTTRGRSERGGGAVKAQRGSEPREVEGREEIGAEGEERGAEAGREGYAGLEN